MGQITTPPSVVLRSGDQVCASASLQQGGCGVRFLVEHSGRIEPAFVVRHAGGVSAFLNRCAHKHVELDWQEGEFFETEGRFLVCATHGALYEPANGMCVSGPCQGVALTLIRVRESDGSVWLVDKSAAVII